MTLRSTQNTHFVPDDLFEKFISGEVDHFNFDNPDSWAIYADGRSEAFDSTVTQAMINDEQAKLRGDYFGAEIIANVPRSVSVVRRSYTCVLTGWTA